MLQVVKGSMYAFTQWGTATLCETAKLLKTMFLT